MVENVVSLRDATVAEDQADVAPRTSSAADETYYSCGRRLRLQRHEINADAEEIARKLRIPVAYLDAIEADRWEALPGRSYAIGYVRAYAEMLELDADEFAACARTEIAPLNPSKMFRFPAPIERASRVGVAVVLSLMVIGAVIAAVVYL